MKENKNTGTLKSDTFGGGALSYSSQRFLAFTLAEMMVVLLILSIVLAAMAPIMTTRIKRDTAGGLNGVNSIWQWSQNNNGIAAYFGADANQTAMIGQTEVVAEDPPARLIINASETRPNHILFKKEADVLGRLSIGETSLVLGNSLAGGNNVLVGTRSFNSNTTGEKNVLLGDQILYRNTSGSQNIAMGTNLLYYNTEGQNNIAIGNSLLKQNITGNNSIAIGSSHIKDKGDVDNNITIGSNILNFSKWKSSSGDELPISSNILLGNNLVNGKYNRGSVNPLVSSNIIIGNNSVDFRILETDSSGNRPFLEGSFSSNIVIGNNSVIPVEADIAYKRSMYGDNNIIIGNEVSNQSSSLSSENIVIGYKTNYQEPIMTEDNHVSSARSVVIGSHALDYGSEDVVIGYKTKNKQFSDGSNSTVEGSATVIGSNSTGRKGSVVVGSGSSALGRDGSIAIGNGSSASGYGSIALGYKAVANHNYSTAIGRGATTTATNQIVLGTTNDTVYIPGRLIVGKESFFGLDIIGDDVAVAGSFGNGGVRGFIGDKSSGFDMTALVDRNLGTDYDKVLNFIKKTPSDRRLKYVGKEFTSGLDKIRQLKVFYYTFKKDEKKTPRVGVIAQDLQKIFPNAVEKGDDGFLTIRMEDMFYALVNAVKELDAKVTAMASDFAKQKEQIKTLTKENKELKAQNKRLEARLNAIEAKLK